VSGQSAKVMRSSGLERSIGFSGDDNLLSDDFDIGNVERDSFDQQRRSQDGKG
jgi:hypothetical protein